MEQHSVSSPLQPLAVLAARKGHAEILQFCLDKGAVFDWNLERSTHFGANIPAMNNILFAEKQVFGPELLVTKPEVSLSNQEGLVWLAL